MIRLMEGDCLELMKAIPDKSIDMVLCDLPYGATACKWDTIIPFENLWREYERVVKDNGAIVLFAAEPFTTKLIESKLRIFRYCWYWQKDRPTGLFFAKKQPLRDIEPICVFYKRQPTYNPQMVKGRPNHKRGWGGKSNHFPNARFTEADDSDLKYPRQLLTFKKEHPPIHPTQKPIELCEYLIKTYTNEGDIVLDNCMGSGSTGVACIKTNRNFIGIEIDENYFNIAKERIEKSK